MTENRPLASRPAAAPLQSHGGRWGDAPIRLGLRLNHAAVLRQAGDGLRPDMARLAEATMRAGADSVVLRVDDQGGLITADDLRRIRDRVRAPLTLELRPDPARLDWLLTLEPAAVTLLPPAGGDVAADPDRLARMVDGLGTAGIAVVMLVGPEPDQIEAVRAAGVRSVEIDTTRYGEADPQHRGPLFQQLRQAAIQARGLGLGIQAGHGLDFATLAPVAALPHLQGITCGRFLIAEALFIGIEDAVRHTRRLIDAARRQARRHAAQTGG